MTILTELATLYDRLAEAGEAPRRGFSRERIGYELLIRSDGTPVALSPLARQDPKRPGRMMNVPAAVIRTAGIKPNIFWDKTAYALGVTAVEIDGQFSPGQGKRTLEEHAAFRAAHLALLEGAADPGLAALRAFLERWTPDRFAELDWDAEALDANIVFRWVDDPVGPAPLHERSAARALLEESSGEEAPCLVTGVRGPLARLHPVIKGVAAKNPPPGGGHRLVSFNIGSDKPIGASSSFGKIKGENAPVSEAAAFAYGTALNTLLDRRAAHRRRFQLGDATAVFWAEGPRAAAQSAEDMLFGAVDPQPETGEDALAKLRADLDNFAAGRRVAGASYGPETRVFVLGLAPNAARLSVRFWRPGTLGDFARHVLGFWEALRIEPAPWKGPPAAWSLLYETARVYKDPDTGKKKIDEKSIPPLLGGALMRAVLTGAPLPRTLLSAVVTRVRADGEINGRRAAICKAVVNGIQGEEVVPMSLKRDNADQAYRLGRLFALLEKVQRDALERDSDGQRKQRLATSIKDRYFAAASSTPARVFPIIIRTSIHHLSKIRKDISERIAGWNEREIEEIWSGLEPDLPRSLTLEAQGRFIAGYYHQSAWRAPKADAVFEGVEE
ncbi:type I-C CRISPR-associated protein Cas8c/Csd1 [Pikeienuella sp. HZG-20]|uniref:type I-C CRISPR-associated protein Cas8c/Csd1 n=1 Tax=Paludibacillus litoralis TaxID=3133267 RepID=UPI0030EF2E51